MEPSKKNESKGLKNSKSIDKKEGLAAVLPMSHADSKDDLFVDAPEELVLSDAKNAAAATGVVVDNKEPVAKNEPKTSNSKKKNKKKNAAKENHSVEVEAAKDDHLLAKEVERLRDLLDKTVVERDSMEKDYKEEQKTFARELANLSHQLKVLTDKELLLGENESGLVDLLSKKEIGESERKSDVPLHELMSECSQFLKSALEERLQRESAIRKLNEVVLMRDQEIEDLQVKLTELSVSQDVTASYLNSVVGVASEFQLEKDQYVEFIEDRMMGYLAMVVNNPEELLDYSISGKITHVEKSTYLLLEKYNQMLYEVYHLGQCLSKVEPDLNVQEEFGKVFAATRDELLELKRRDVELVEKISHLDDENRKMIEQVEKDKETVEAVNAELSNTKAELEQEKTRCTNTKEKLSMAVTKGKALVQQRDSLKQSLADKMSELEKFLAELQEKSSALQAAELSKEELVRSENLVASLQETLSQRNLILEKIEEIMSSIDVPEELQSVDMAERIKWLVNERNELKVVSREFYKLKDAICLIDLPETVSFSDLESRLDWLKESFYQAKGEANLLLDELDRTKEAARNEIDRLSASLLSELQEKDYIQKELDDVGCKYEEIVKKADKVSLEKDQIMKILQEESGIIMEDQDGVNQTSSDFAMLISRSLGKVREDAHASFDTKGVDSELFERLQRLLYVRNQDLMMCEQLLEEEIPAKLQLNKLSNELRLASEELGALKQEKDSLQKDLEQSVERSAMLREKLSMAVKKGKGLVQDRENLRAQLDEKNSEIEKLRLKLEQQEITVSECRDEINRLSTDLECVPKLEDEVAAMKDQRDQLEQFLSESNNMLQRVIESVDHIVLPVDSVFKEPAEKVNQIAIYISECQDAKTCLEKELGNAKEEASALASKLTEAQATMKSLEDALSVTEDKITQLTKEKSEIEISKENIEQELEKAIEEASLQTGKFSEACASRKSLEDELSVAEKNISALINEKEEALGGKAAAVMELETVREEVTIQTSKLTEAYKTIKSLEDTLSQVETNVSFLTEQNNVLQVGRTTLENELQKLKDEAEFQAVKVANSQTTIKSLEDALLKSENDASVLEGEKRVAEQEISTLNSKLSACMEELAGTSGNLRSSSAELIGYLNDLQMVMKDETLLSMVKQCFERKIESLQNISLIIKDIRDRVVDKGSEALSQPDIEGNSLGTGPFTNDLHSIEAKNGDVNVADADNISSCFRKTAEGFQMRNKLLADKFEGFSIFIDEFIAALLRKLQTTRDEVIRMTQSTESLKQNVKDMEVYKREQEEAMAMLKNDVAILLSVYTDATKELQFEVKNNLLELNSVPELEELSLVFYQEAREIGGKDTAEHQKKLYGNKYAETAEKLLFSVRQAQNLTKLFERTSTVAASTIQDLQKKLQETTTAFEKAIEERDEHQNRISKLENDLDALKDSCRELKLKVEDYQAQEDKLKEKEAEILSLSNSLSVKEQEAEKVIEERDHYQNMVSKLESDLDAVYDSCRELKIKVEDYQAQAEKLKEKDAEISSLSGGLSKKEQEAEKAIEERDYYQNKVSKLENDLGALEDSCGELKLKVEDYQALEDKLKEKEAEISSLSNSLSLKEQEAENILQERDHHQNKVSKLENDLYALQESCRELRLKVEDYQAQEDKLKEKEPEISSLSNSSSTIEQEVEETFLTASQLRTLVDKVTGIEIPSAGTDVRDLESESSFYVKKLFYIIDSVGELQRQINLLVHEKEELQSTLSTQNSEIELLKGEVETHIRTKPDTEKMKTEFSEFILGLQKIINMLGGSEYVIDLKSASMRGLLPVLEKQVITLLSEAENSKSTAQELDTKLLGSQKFADELTTKVKLLEDSLQGRTVQPEIIQERSVFEAPSLPAGSEISEIEDVKSIPPVPPAAHVRSMRKGSADHLALNIDSESASLIKHEETDEDKGHVFKSLNTSGLIPKQGKMVADRIDGIWVSGGRVLMNRPRARLGLIAYWLVLHLWLLASIL